MGKQGILYLESFHEAIRPLKESDRLKMYDAVFDYGFSGILPELPPHLRGYFSLIKPVIDSSKKRYTAAVKNGAKGGAPSGNQNARKKQPDKQPDVQPENNQDKDMDMEVDMDTDKAIDIEPDPDTEMRRAAALKQLAACSIEDTKIKK